MQKKFLDINGVEYFARLLNNYPDNELLSTVITAIQNALDEKASTALATTTSSGLMSANDKTVLDNLNISTTTTISNGLVENIHIANSKGTNLINWECQLDPIIISSQTRTSNLLNVDNVQSQAYITAGGAVTSSERDLLGDFIPVSPNDDIYYTGIVGETYAMSINRRLHVYDANKNWIKQLNYASNLSRRDSWSIHGIVPSNGAYVRVSWGSTDYNLMITVNAPSFYEPYYVDSFSPISSATFYVSPDNTLENANLYTVNIPIEIYSCKINLTTGKLYATTGYISNYNGETLPGSWISDRDTYVSGTSPSIGSKVIYTLASEDVQEYDLIPMTIPTFYHHNYFWVNNGKIVSLTYEAETFAVTHLTIYDSVSFGNTNIQENNIIGWNHAADIVDNKANLDSPTFTGSVNLPIPGNSSNSTTAATTAFVMNRFKESIAPVEWKTASKNYNKGEYLFESGKLYKATTAIPSGTTLTIGTNIEKTDIGTELNLLFAQLSS